MKWLVLLFVVACGAGGAAQSPSGPVNHPAKLEGAPYTLAIVLNGWEIWIGNDKILPEDDPSMYAGGALEAIKSGVGKSMFAKSSPGSQAMVVVYTDKPEIKLPLGPIEKLDPAAFGTQKDYYNKTGVELVSAIELAAAELDKVNGGKKFIFVIGDGNDTNNEAAVPRLARLKTTFAASGIHVVSFVYKTKLSGEETVITKLTDESQTATTTDVLATQLQTALDGLAKRAN